MAKPTGGQPLGMLEAHVATCVREQRCEDDDESWSTVKVDIPDEIFEADAADDPHHCKQ